MDKRAQLMTAAAKRILVKDGPYGTEIQRAGIDARGYCGDIALSGDQKGNNDLLNLTQPALIRRICDSYLDAGAHLLATNTFNANRISQADYGAEDYAHEINVAAAQIIREAVDAREDGVPRFVAGAVGPTNKTLSLSPDVEDPGYREVSFDEIRLVYREQIAALLEGGADFILLETVFDTLNCKAGIVAANELASEWARDIPLMISMTLTDLSGRNLSGHTVEAFWNSIRHANPVAIGLNCSFGADQLRPHVQLLSSIADTLVLAYPNAGLPNELGAYDELPERTAALVTPWAENGRINILGGCCGSTPEHIAAMARAVADHEPRDIPLKDNKMRLAGLEPFTIAA